jgi:hypothetical protein
MVWTGFIRLRIESCGGHLCYRNEPSGSAKGGGFRKPVAIPTELSRLDMEGVSNKFRHGTDFSRPHSVQTGSEAHPDPHRSDTGGRFPRE